MSIKDKFEYCAHCSKSTFSMEDGRRCSLTGRGPEFENRCEHFDGDEAEVEKAIKDEQRAVEESVGIHGFLAFYLYFCVIGGIILTIINTLTSHAFSSGIYSVSRSLLVCDILMLGAFVAIGGYTVIALFSLVWAGIFFTYLTVSEDVKILIPKETRHLFKGDKIALVTVVVVILILFGYGVLEVAVAGY